MEGVTPLVVERRTPSTSSVHRKPAIKRVSLAGFPEPLFVEMVDLYTLRNSCQDIYSERVLSPESELQGLTGLSATGEERPDGRL